MDLEWEDMDLAWEDMDPDQGWERTKRLMRETK